MRRTMTAVAAILVSTSATAGPSLTATAGLGGLVRASRWTPVQVTITSEAPHTVGDLVLSWGGATVRRHIVFESPGTRRVDLYVRTSDAVPRMQVRFTPQTGPANSIDLAVRVLRDDERLAVCIVPDLAAAPDNPNCTVSLPPAALPFSLRGYEAADAVSWPLGRVGLQPAQAAALAQWETMKRLDASGALSLTPQAVRPTVERGLPSYTALGLVGISGAYLLMLAFLGRACGQHVLRARTVGAAMAVGVTLACALVLALGRLGPGRGVTVHHRSVLQQVPGADAALLSMRAVAEFSARDAVALRLPAPDGAIEASAQQGPAETHIDAAGFPTLLGTFGLASRQAFAAEAVVPLQLLALDDGPRGVRITNRSPHAMEGCELASGLTPPTVETLASGGVIEATWQNAASETSPPGQDVLGPLVRCSVRAAAVSLTEGRRPVYMQGTTVVALYRTPAPLPLAAPEGP